VLLGRDELGGEEEGVMDDNMQSGYVEYGGKDIPA
jgi:hypothetical protein